MDNKNQEQKQDNKVPSSVDKNYPLTTLQQSAQKHRSTSWYRRAFGKVLNYAVTPKIVGNVPVDLGTANNSSESNPVVFYVLQERSRSNSQLVDNETRRLVLPQALAHVKTENFDEKAAIIYIRNGKTKSISAQQETFSPRLARVLQAVQKTNAEVLLVPVSINWGRDPGKNSSLLKILAAESWADATISKQLLNIGIHGRDNTYLQFHPSINLRSLLTQVTTQNPREKAIKGIEAYLSAYLDQQREVILGPDLSDRRTEVDNILYAPAIQHAIKKSAQTEGKTTNDLSNEVRGYMDEIVADYSSTFVRGIRDFLNWLWNQLYDGVDVHHFEGLDNNPALDNTDPDVQDETSLRVLAEKYELIFLPCHRSHVDYLLIMYVLYINGLRTPYVAAGDNLNMPVVGSFMRKGGSFFLRRSFKGDYLYTAVFREYIHSIVSRNIPLKFFLEGGRSRSGKLLHPKTGMIAMTVQSRLREQKGKPIAYIPTYVGYERLAEGNSYLGEMQGKPKETETVFQLFKAMRKIERIYGVVHVNFGEAVLLDDVLAKNNVESKDYDPYRNDQPLQDNAKQAVNDIAIETLENINKAAVINPISLLSLVLLSTPKHALTEESCIEQLDLYREMAQKSQYDERTILTELTGADIIEYGLKLKMITRVPHIMGDMISVADDQTQLLEYFRNNILHLFIMPSMIAALVHHNGRMLKEDISSIIHMLYPFIQFELFLKWKEAELESVISNIIDMMVDVGLLMDDGKDMLFAEMPNTVINHQLGVLATPVQQTLKRYFMTLALMSQQGSGNITEEQIVELCFLLGQRLSVLYESGSAELFDKTLFKGFIKALKRQHYIEEDEDNHIIFNTDVDNIAQNARFVLDEETLTNIKQFANFTPEEIAKIVADLDKKKQKRFSRKSK